MRVAVGADEIRWSARRHIVRSDADHRPVAAHAASPSTRRGSTPAFLPGDRRPVLSRSNRRNRVAVRAAGRLPGPRREAAAAETTGGAGRRQGDARYRTRCRDRPGKRRPRRQAQRDDAADQGLLGRLRQRPPPPCSGRPALRISTRPCIEARWRAAISPPAGRDDEQNGRAWAHPRGSAASSPRGAHLLRPLLKDSAVACIAVDVVGNDLVGGEEAGFLVGEVLVEGAPGDRGGLGDVGDGRRVVAALGDGVDQRGDDPLALVLDDELARQPVATGGQAR